ncbi:uncharacterized protein LOC125832764 [Solanum verrucosum]|uniref:uncharacterized protein LOC125832764 n=1 Tax=Solanum verrucosum TaxID=315347 RepID=UPI0020D0DE7C|nr:uncharacterized protein LOC125832764 [Solanum verrucosum]
MPELRNIHELKSLQGKLAYLRRFISNLAENVANFIRVNIIYRFGIPRYIITDNDKPFDNKLMNKICDLFGFKQRKFSMYHATANGLAEAFNKTLCNLLKKVVSKSKWDWYERMEEALRGYRTTYRTPTQATPYSLAFGVEAVLPLEHQIPSLRLTENTGTFSNFHVSPTFDADDYRLFIKDCQTTILKAYDISTSRRKAYLGRKRAFEKVYGTWEGSFAEWPWFMEAMKHFNPGTIVEW